MQIPVKIHFKFHLIMFINNGLDPVPVQTYMGMMDAFMAAISSSLFHNRPGEK
ncbi:hypothetical protein [Acinetobacter sp. A47]|uniref:hypothetical protein n=1 Tax=Acinetobacter sp. A47 TaxID=1561217 RepID=UPI0013792F55|nr:hypothetical protein [Acinetobacter sp. A47]